jgi:hypothetical protein
VLAVGAHPDDIELGCGGAPLAHRARGDEAVPAAPCPYGDGHTAERVVEVLHAPDTPGLLELAEPDFVDRPVPC